MTVSLVLLSVSAESKTKYLPEVPACKNTLGSDLPMVKGTDVLIHEYKAETDTFEVLNPDFPGEDLSDVTLQSLTESIKKVKTNRETILAKPEDIVGEQYTLEKDIPTLTEKELAQRKSCSRLAK